MRIYTKLCAQYSINQTVENEVATICSLYFVILILLAIFAVDNGNTKNVF